MFSTYDLLNLIHFSFHEIEEVLVDVPKLCNVLHSVRVEQIKHSQLAAAQENFKHIFNVPETVENVQLLLNEGKLLEGHKVNISIYDMKSISQTFKLILTDRYSKILTVHFFKKCYSIIIW